MLIFSDLQLIFSVFFYNTNLDKEWDTVEAADDGAVVSLSGEDVQSSDSSLDNLLHTYAVNVGSGVLATRLLLSAGKMATWKLVTNRKL